MAIETEIAVAARDALPPFTSQASANNAGAAAPGATPADVPVAPEEGVTLTLSAQGRLLSAFASIVDGAAADVAAADAAEAADTAQRAGQPGSTLPPYPITRATLYAIEARLVAARRGPDAVRQADAEVPQSDDPTRLQQARQATDSLYGRTPNPFAGRSRAELSAIIYDESGAYTVNERYAAANQRTELDQRFWAPVFQRAVASGDWRPVIEAALVFYAALSPLEQTAYPDNYVQLMRQYLALYNLQPQAQAPLPPQQQVDLLHMMESLVLPSGPLALAGGVIRGLVLPRAPSMAELIASAPHLADLVQVSNLVRSIEDSAYLVLLQRVFGVGRREDEPAVARRGAAAQARDYLAYGDRRYLAEAYAWAQANGLEPEEVDALAADLAAYRRARTEGAAPRSPSSAVAVTGAAPQYYRMHADDMAAAQRMLGSRAARATHLDHGFLAWLLDPGGGGWSEAGASGHLVGFSALERLLAGLAGIGIDERAGSDSELEAGYRYALYRIGLQEAPEARALPAVADGARSLTLAAQLAALARSDAADLAFMNNALLLLRMYKFSLKMSDTEQRTLAELVYSSLRKRRARPRRGKLFVLWGERSPWMPSLPAAGG